jgi:NAD-dependent dihydropyrimidine dehydrogenase PreA subunit/ribosomal protein L37AE/L43A
MSFRVVEDLCIGCGGCEYACPRGALTKTDSFLGLFVIDPFLCDDCAECVPKCPVFAIVADEQWAVCQGKGCPLTSNRLAGFECAVWTERCPKCGATLWRRDADVWACSRCDLEMKVHCPRTRFLDAPAPSTAARTTAETPLLAP